MCLKKGNTDAFPKPWSKNMPARLLSTSGGSKNPTYSTKSSWSVKESTRGSRTLTRMVEFTLDRRMTKARSTEKDHTSVSKATYMKAILIVTSWSMAERL